MWYELTKEKVYRISKVVEDREIAGRAATFKGYLERQGDIRRAIMHINRPGETVQEWFINPHYIIDL